MGKSPCISGQGWYPFYSGTRKTRAKDPAIIMQSTQFAQTFIQQPAVEATVERLPTNDLCLRWLPQANRVTIYGGHSPDAIDRATPLAAVDASIDQEARLSGLDPAVRFYFELVFDGGPADGRSLVVAERVLPLTGGVNFRDVGGYPTRDGRTVRWGQVFRSGSLADLTDADLVYLQQLDLKTVCDLRTPEEMEAHPDRLPSGVNLWPLSMEAQVSRLRQSWVLFRKRNRLQEVLQEAYTQLILGQNGRHFGDLFHRLANPDNLPAVIHCTAGKDRTGVSVALLLAALGVDDEIIIADYSLSNAVYDILATRMAPDMRRLFSLGFDERQLRAFLLAEPQTMQGTLAHIRGRYGSVREYLLRMGGVTAETIEQVQANLLD